MGVWNSTNQIFAEANGQSFSWIYNSCYYPEALCSLTDIDCIKIYEIVISHNSPNLTLKFSSSIAETNPAVAFWGIKDLTIGIRTCNSKC